MIVRNQVLCPLAVLGKPLGSYSRRSIQFFVQLYIYMYIHVINDMLCHRSLETLCLSSSMEHYLVLLPKLYLVSSVKGEYVKRV